MARTKQAARRGNGGPGNRKGKGKFHALKKPLDHHHVSFDPILEGPKLPTEKQLQERIDKLNSSVDPAQIPPIHILLGLKERVKTKQVFHSVLTKKIQELTPSQEEQTILSDFVNKIQTILYGLIVSPGSFDACQIDEVREVGSYKKGTMIKGDNLVDLVIVLKTLPTREAVNLLGNKVLEIMMQKDPQEVTTMLPTDNGFNLSTSKATVAIHISTIRENVKILEDGLHMDRKILSSAHLMLVQSRWVEENAMDSTIKMLTRLLLDLRNRYKWFQPLTPWMIDLIAHYCVLNTSDRVPLPLDQAYKRFFKILSAGFFLPRSAGIIDPFSRVQNDRIHMRFMTLEEQDQVCMMAQNLLRVLSHSIEFRDIENLEKFLAVEKYSKWTEEIKKVNDGPIGYSYKPMVTVSSEEQKAYTKPVKVDVDPEMKAVKTEKNDGDTEMKVVKTEMKDEDTEMKEVKTELSDENTQNKVVKTEKKYGYYTKNLKNKAAEIKVNLLSQPTSTDKKKSDM